MHPYAFSVLRTATVLCGLSATAAYAKPCDGNAYDKGLYLTQAVARKIVKERYLDGQDIRSRLLGCDFNALTNQYTLDVNITWNGAFIRANTYGVRGELTIQGDGTGSRFSPTEVSPSVSELQKNGLIVLGVVAVGAIAAEALSSSNASSSGSIGPAAPPAPPPAPAANAGVPLYVTNKCPSPVRVALHYQDPRTSQWVTDAWWDFKPQESSTLLDANGQGLRTQSEFFYFYAETTDNTQRAWKGEHNFQRGNITHPMRQVQDKQASRSDLILECP